MKSNSNSKRCCGKTLNFRLPNEYNINSSFKKKHISKQKRGVKTQLHNTSYASQNKNQMN